MEEEAITVGLWHIFAQVSYCVSRCVALRCVALRGMKKKTSDPWEMSDLKAAVGEL